jgi:hypothetical protein
MSLLDSGLTFHRGLVLSVLPDTAQRVRPTLIADHQGGETAGAPDTSLLFSCRLAAKAQTALELAEAGRLVAVMKYTLYCPHGTDLLPTDQVKCNGGLFEVLDDADKRSSAAGMTVNLREIR